MPETKLESRTPRAADTAQPQPKSHGLALKDRRHLAVTGVIRVISCDENAAVLEYLQYAENQQSGGSLLARLFR